MNKSDITLQQATDKALNFLAARMHSKKELYTKLCRNFSSDVAQCVVEDMVRIGYVNDEQFAALRIKKLLSKQKSIAEIKADLYAKGICSDIINSELQNISNYDEAQECVALIRKKYMTKMLNGEHQKVMAAMARRGFSYNSAKNAIMQVDEEI